MRPHSADFLEYEARAEAAAEAVHMMNAAKPDAMRAPRPKSSLDINRTPDSFYYSEASYADKMRKSALYLQHPQAAQQQTAAGSSYKGNSEFLSPAGNGMNTIGYENPYERVYKRNELLSETANPAASMPRMSRGGLTGSSSSTQLRSPTAINAAQQAAQTFSPPGTSYYTPVTTQQIIAQNEQLLRSASARLPRRSSTFDEDFAASNSNNSTACTTGANSPASHQDGERKREESMKRLLEWKQRMLQSPLTRKSAQQAASGNSNMTAMAKLGSNPNILLSSTTVASGAHYNRAATTAVSKLSTNSTGGIPVGGVGGIQRSRSESQANMGPTAGYNSYSSDDEGMLYLFSIIALAFNREFLIYSLF